MSKDNAEGPVFYEPTGVYIAPGSVVLDLKKKDPEQFKKAMEESDKTYRKMAGLPNLQDSKTIDALADFLNRTFANHIFQLSVAASIEKTAVKNSVIDVQCKEKSFIPALKKLVVDNPDYYICLDDKDPLLKSNPAVALKNIKAIEWMRNDSGHEPTSGMSPRIPEFALGEKYMSERGKVLPKIIIAPNSIDRAMTIYNAIARYYEYPQQEDYLQKNAPGHVVYVFALNQKSIEGEVSGEKK